jgi:hypothetical protein
VHIEAPVTMPLSLTSSTMFTSTYCDLYAVNRLQTHFYPTERIVFLGRNIKQINPFMKPYSMSINDQAQPQSAFIAAIAGRKCKNLFES